MGELDVESPSLIDKTMAIVKGAYINGGVEYWNHHQGPEIAERSRESVIRKMHEYWDREMEQAIRELVHAALSN